MQLNSSMEFKFC